MKVDRRAALVCVSKVLGKRSMLAGFGLRRCDLEASEGWGCVDFGRRDGASLGVIGSRGWELSSSVIIVQLRAIGHVRSLVVCCWLLLRMVRFGVAAV